MHTDTLNNDWVQVELIAPARIKTVLIVNREDTEYAEHERISPSDIRVGNDPDISLNPSCGVTVTAGGVFKCDLVGKYIGLIQLNTEHMNLCELRAYAWESIETTGTAAQSYTFNTDLSADRPIDPSNLWISNGSHTSSVHQSVAEPNPWWGVSFSSSRYINMVSVIGNFSPGDERESEDMELWVGDSLVPTENTRIGGTFNYKFEQAVNAFGKHVFIRRVGATLALTQVVVLSDCDCRGLTWDKSGTTGFPLQAEVG